MSNGDLQLNGGEPPARARWRRRSSTISAAILGGVVVLFAVFNSQSVRVDWLLSTTSTPLIVLIVVVAAFGFVGGQLSARHQRRSK